MLPEGQPESGVQRSCVPAHWLVAESLGNDVVVQAVSEGEEDVASLEEADMTTSRSPACFHSGNENMTACRQLGGTCPKGRSCC
jgi:hypothetical protein